MLRREALYVPTQLSFSMRKAGSTPLQFSPPLHLPISQRTLPIGGQAIQQRALSSLFPLALCYRSYFTIRARDAEPAEPAALTSAPPAREQKQGHALS